MFIETQIFMRNSNKGNEWLNFLNHQNKLSLSNGKIATNTPALSIPASCRVSSSVASPCNRMICLYFSEK